MPNISHVFRQDQHLYLLYEVYDPTREKAAENQPKGTKPGISLLSSLELMQGSVKVYETPLVQAKAINVDGRNAVSVELDVPLERAEAGPVRVPAERGRRCRRQLCLSAICGAGEGAESRRDSDSSCGNPVLEIKRLEKLAASAQVWRRRQSCVSLSCQLSDGRERPTRSRRRWR